jgi:hypothetical protein
MGEPDVPHGFFVSASKRPWKSYSMAFLVSANPVRNSSCYGPEALVGRVIISNGARCDDKERLKRISSRRANTT